MYPGAVVDGTAHVEGAYEESRVMRLQRWIIGGLLVTAVLLSVPLSSPACPFCTSQGQTLTDEIKTASMVLYGKLSNASEKNETVDIAVEEVIKDHPTLGKQKKLTLSRYVDLSLTGDKDRFLVFCDIFKGKIDPYRGMALKSGSKLPEYLRGALNVKDKGVGDKLKFFFEYLDSDDNEISNDAYKEFGNADYKDFKGMAKALPTDRVLKWLKSPDTPSFRVGLYASMLGHAGAEKDAGVLKALLDDPERKAGSGVDGIMAGYAMLKPKEGWNYIQSVLKNGKEEFMFRYAALRAVRFLYDYRTDLVSKKQLVEGLCVMLDQEDIADLAIEDLRKWHAWDKADKVLAVVKSDAYKAQPIVKRAVLRYALQCKDSKAAEAFVTERRKADVKAVEEAEELLKLEQDTIKAEAPVTKAGK